jgi:hypothetical protein
VPYQDSTCRVYKDSGMIPRLAAFGVWRKELSDSATLLPVIGQSELASVQTEPFKYKIHGNLRCMRWGRTCATTRSN